MVPWHSRPFRPGPGRVPHQQVGQRPGIFFGFQDPRAGDSRRPRQLDLYGTLAEKHVGLTRRQVRLMYRDVRERTERVFSGLTPEQLREKSRVLSTRWTGASTHRALLRIHDPAASRAGSEPVLPGHDVHALFDSFRAAHDDRWKPKEVVGSDPTLGEIRRYRRRH